jgi:hypothetical protein
MVAMKKIENFRLIFAISKNCFREHSAIGKKFFIKHSAIGKILGEFALPKGSIMRTTWWPSSLAAAAATSWQMLPKTSGS